MVATYAIADEYIKHPDDQVYYTAPVFFWTNIELSLGVVCACLPILRPIWRLFLGGLATPNASRNKYEPSSLKGTKNGSFASNLASKPYKKIYEMDPIRLEAGPPVHSTFEQ